MEIDSKAFKKIGAALVAGLSLMGAGSAEAVPPAILFDDSNNLAQAMAAPGSSSSLATGGRGIAFTVGANSIDLMSVAFGMYGNVSGNSVVGLKLYQGSSNSGSTLLQTLASFTVSLDTIANGGTLVTFNTGGWTLDASTQYFVAAYYTSAGSTVTARLGTTALASGSWTQSGLTSISSHRRALGPTTTTCS